MLKWIWLLLPGLAAVPAFEANPEFEASDIVPPAQLRSAHHRLRPSVPNDGFMNHYVVVTPHGEFAADGNRQLNFRVQEAHALAQLDEVARSDLFLDAATRAVAAPVNAVNQFVDAPAETVKGIPGGIARGFRSLTRSAKRGAAAANEAVRKDDAEDGAEGNEGEQTDEDSEEQSATKKYALKWFGVTGAERRWAEKLQVDPYSSNTVLREKISEVARVDAAASFGVKLAMPGLGAVSYVVSVSQLVWRVDPEELRAQNLKRLSEAGISSETIETFLDNPVYSPTHQTIIVLSLVDMIGVEGLESILTLASWAQSESQAWLYADAVRMLAGVHAGTPGRAIENRGPLPGLLTHQGNLVYGLPVDYLTWSETLSQIVHTRLPKPAELAGSAQILLTGSASPTATAALAELGWSVRGGVSLQSSLGQ